MYLAIDSIWLDFEKEHRKSENIEVIEASMVEKYNLSLQEAGEIGLLVKYLVDRQFSEKTLKKMKKKNPELYECMEDLTMTGIFFGMFLSKYLY